MRDFPGGQRHELPVDELDLVVRIENTELRDTIELGQRPAPPRHAFSGLRRQSRLAGPLLAHEAQDGRGKATSEAGLPFSSRRALIGLNPRHISNTPPPSFSGVQRELKGIADMFTRRGDARGNARVAAEPSLTEMQLLTAIQEARTAAAPVVLAAQQPREAINATPLATPPPMPQPAVAAADAPDDGHADDRHSVIGEDLTIEGQSITIRCRGALEINGRIQAELHSRQLVVGRSGQVEGIVAADSVDVFGRVSGTIMGSRVVLHASAEVDGDIHARTLSVADGATFEGRSRKVTDAAAIAPRLDPDAPTASTAPVSVPVPLPRDSPLAMPAGSA